MSSVYRCRNGYCFEGAKAVDGIYGIAGNGILSLVHSNKQTNPWIQIDLGYATCISAVEIWNRHDPNDPGILIIKLFDTIIRLICGINHKVVK